MLDSLSFAFHLLYVLTFIFSSPCPSFHFSLAVRGPGVMQGYIHDAAATAAVMCPIALSAASQLGVSPDSLLMAVAIGASCSFLTPIGHQNNTLILSPGGFRFGDYWRLGLPLEILVALVSVPLLLVVWPL